jgi:predicted RNA-binding protein
MCLARLYEATKSDEPVLEDVAYMVIDGDRVEVETLFGEKRILHATVRQVDFLNSRIQVNLDRE